MTYIRHNSQFSRILASALILFMVLTSIPAPVQAADNLLVDGDMEFNDMSEWRNYGSPDLVEKSQDKVFSGVQSLHILTNNPTVGGTRGGIQKIGTTGTPLNIEANKRYRVSYSYLVESGQLRGFLGVGTSNADFEEDVAIFAPTDGAWVYYSREFVTPDNFAINERKDLRIIFNLLNGEAYIDNVVLEEIVEEEPAPVDPVPVDPVEPPAEQNNDEENNNNNNDTVVYHSNAQEQVRPSTTWDAYAAPTVYINDGAPKTNSREVVLHFDAKNVTQLTINEDNDFSAVTFQPYQGKHLWTLSEGNGKKTVYVQFRSNTGAMVKSSASIILDAPEVVDPVPATPPVVSGQPVVPQYGVGGFEERKTLPVECAMPAGVAYRDIKTQHIYFITASCTKRVFPNEQVLQSYTGYVNTPYLTVTELVNMVRTDDVATMPWGPAYVPADGSYVKAIGDTKIYLLMGNKKYWIANELVYQALGKSEEDLIHVDAGLLNKYEYVAKIGG